MKPLNWKVMTSSLGTFGAVMYVSCVVYGLLVPERFHAAQLLETVLPGFRWLIEQAKSPGSGSETALDIAKRRYAKGEITKDQFEAMKRDLS